MQFNPIISSISTFLHWKNSRTFLGYQPFFSLWFPNTFPVQYTILIYTCFPLFHNKEFYDLFFHNCKTRFFMTQKSGWFFFLDFPGAVVILNNYAVFGVEVPGSFTLRAINCVCDRDFCPLTFAITQCE